MQGRKWEPAVKQNTRQGRLYILVVESVSFRSLLFASTQSIVSVTI